VRRELDEQLHEHRVAHLRAAVGALLRGAVAVDRHERRRVLPRLLGRQVRRHRVEVRRPQLRLELGEDQLAQLAELSAERVPDVRVARVRDAEAAAQLPVEDLQQREARLQLLGRHAAQRAGRALERRQRARREVHQLVLRPSDLAEGVPEQSGVR